MTRHTTTRWAAIAVLVVTPLVACGDDDDASSTTLSTSVLPPVIVDVNSLDGTTVEVPEGGTIDITGDEATYTDWEASIADPAVVSFTPGREEGDAQFNPGLQATAVGSTEVTLTNSSSGTTVTFTVDVTGA